MSTSNIYQTTKLDNLDVEAIVNKITVFPKILEIGSGQGNWKPVPYARAKKEVLRVSMDAKQLSPVSIADNVLTRIGIAASTESISINPFIVEILESSWVERDVDDVIPIVLSTLNVAYDEINIRNLRNIAKKGSAITWAGAFNFHNSMLDIVCSIAEDLEKVLIIPEKLSKSLRMASDHAVYKNWYEELQTQMKSLNTRIIFSSLLDNEIYFINKMYLAEYQGYVPRVYRDGFDPKVDEYWLHFIFSSTDFKARDAAAVQSFELSGYDPSKLGVVCPNSSQ